MKRGFTLIEMLVVMGIIVALMAACLVGYRKMLVMAEKTKCRELVSNAATALAALYTDSGAWPRSLRNANTAGGAKILDGKAAYALASRGFLSLEVSSESAKSGKTAGLDKFGLITPTAAKVVKRLGNSATLSSMVTSGSTIEDHILRFAIDLDGDGVIEDVNVGGETLAVRANAVVWCCGKDGKILPFHEGVRSDYVHSWTEGQIVK